MAAIPEDGKNIKKMKIEYYVENYMKSTGKEAQD